jgi:hypothetical protein
VLNINILSSAIPFSDSAMCLALLPGSTIRSSPLRLALAACAAALLAASGAMAAVPVQSDDIADLSLEALANIKVTPLSRQAARSDAAASVFVNTGNDVRRPEARTHPRRAHRLDALTRPPCPCQANNRQGCDHSGFRTQRTRHHP